jgi:hypothetical protein
MNHSMEPLGTTMMSQEAAANSAPRVYKKLVDYSTRRAPASTLDDSAACTSSIPQANKPCPATSRSTSPPSATSPPPRKASSARRGSMGAIISRCNEEVNFSGHDSTATFASSKTQTTRAPRRSTMNHSSDARRPLQRFDAENQSSRSVLKFSIKVSPNKVVGASSPAVLKSMKQRFHKTVKPVAPQLEDGLHDSVSTLATTKTTTVSRPTTQDTSSGAHLHEESWSSLPVDDSRDVIKERRTKMNWLANNAPKRNLQETLTESNHVPPMLKIIFAKGKEPMASTSDHHRAVNSDSQEEERLDNIPEEDGLGEDDECKSLTFDDRRRGLLWSTGQQNSSKDDLECDYRGEGAVSWSLRTLTGQQPKVSASTQRRSSTSFVAGSQIRTYSVVR